MQLIGLDTNAYTAFRRGHADVVEVLRHAESIVVCTTVVGELLAGFAAGSREATNRAELLRFLESPRVTHVPLTLATADRYALVYAALRRAGRPIPTNDLWIAASCLEHGAALLTSDAHFREVGGLRVGAQLAEFLP